MITVENEVVDAGWGGKRLRNVTERNLDVILRMVTKPLKKPDK